MASLSKNDLQRPVGWLLLLAWTLAAAAAVVLIVRSYDLFQTKFAIFPTYYAAAKLIENGEDIANFYDDAWFFQRASEIQQPEIYNANTPLMGFFFLPLAQLSYDSARGLTSIVGFAALIAAAYLMAAELNITGLWRAAAFFSVFAAPTTLLNLITAQVYPLVLLTLVLAWLAWRRHAEAVGGMLIGVTVAFKTAGLFLVALMVFERRWRALLAFAGALAVLVALTFPFVQIDGWSAYFHYASAMAVSPKVANAYYWSVPGFARNLFMYDEQWNRDPYIDAPVLARSIEMVVLVAVILSAARVVSVAKDRDITFALFAILSVIFMPLTSGTHLCVAFLPAFIIFSRIADRLVSPLGAWFLVGGILAFAPGADRIQALADSGGPFFLYPRFFGLVILAGLLMRLGLENRTLSTTG